MSNKIIRKIKAFVYHKLLRRRYRSIQEIYYDEFIWNYINTHKLTPNTYTVNDFYLWEFEALEKQFNSQTEELPLDYNLS